MSAQGNSMELETYDRNWKRKFDRIEARIKELDAKGWRTPQEVAEYRNLSKLMCEISDAGLRTPELYMRRHLALTIRDADENGITAWWPKLSAYADIDTVRAAVSEVQAYVSAVKKRRQTIAVCERAGMTPQVLTEVPKVSLRTRWAMLKFWLARKQRIAQNAYI